MNIQEDPGEAVFFRPDNPEGQEQPDPFAFTTDNTVSCPSSATINGVWARGATQTLNTFASFYHVQGPATDQDLRDDPGPSNTGYVDKGSGQNGTHSAVVAYNNVAGNSYQLSVKNGTGPGGPEQLGAVLFIAPGQCTPIPGPPTEDLAWDHEALLVEASQAQCSGDKVEFTIRVRDAEANESINATIIDGDTDTVSLVIERGMMFQYGSLDRLLHFNRTLTSGPWAVLAIHLNGDALAPDHFDLAPFYVPANPCAGDGAAFSDANLIHHIDAVRDQINTTVLPKLNTSLTDHTTMGVYAHCEQTTATSNDCEGLRFTMTSQHTGQGLGTHTGGGAGEDTAIMGLAPFPGMTAGGTSILILLFTLMLWALWQGKTWLAIASFLGLLATWIPELVSESDYAGIVGTGLAVALIIIALWTESMVEGWRLRKGS